MYNTYNMGLYDVAVDPADVDKTMEAMKAAGNPHGWDGSWTARKVWMYAESRRDGVRRRHQFAGDSGRVGLREDHGR